MLYNTFKKSQNVHRKVLDKSTRCSFIVDSVGNILYCSEAGRSLYEKGKSIISSKGNQMSNRIFDIVHPDYRKKLSNILKRHKDNSHQVIFMDVNMPVTNGYEATEKIRAIENTNKCPRAYICGLTISERKLTADAYLDYGMDYYMKNPINIEEMIRIAKDNINALE